MIKKVLHNSNTLNKCQCVGILNQNSVWNAKHTMSSLFLECCWMSSDAYPYWTPAINDHHGFVWVLERAGTRPAPLRQLANWMAWFHSLKTWGATQWPSRRPTRLEIHMLKHSNISKIKTCPLFMWTCAVVMSEAQIEVWSVFFPVRFHFCYKHIVKIEHFFLAYLHRRVTTVPGNCYHLVPCIGTCLVIISKDHTVIAMAKHHHFRKFTQYHRIFVI